METRRKDYRHAFPSPKRLKVLVKPARSRSPVVGDIVDLSVHGMRVHFAEEPASLTQGDDVIAEASLPGVPAPLGLRSRVVYVQTEGEARYLGFHFLPTATLQMNEDRDRTIWRFLLQAQREARQLARV